MLGSINVSERKVRFDSLIKAFRSPVWQLTENNGYGIGIKNAMDNGTVLFSSSSAIEVQQEFARKYISWNAFNDRQTIAIKILEKELHKSNEKISKIEHELSKHEGHSKYKVYADLIMANLWQIEDGQKEIKLKDFEGKYTYLFFGTTDHYGCMMEYPFLQWNYTTCGNRVN